MTASESTPPAVSVVIATHDRAELLADTLGALAQQTFTDFEVVVVDDESTDHTEEVARAHGARWVRVSRRGPGRARQEGWQLAQGRVVAFTDDDCVPQEGWLDALQRPIEKGEADFVQGRTLPRPDRMHLLGRWARTQWVEEPNELFQTCNIAYRRDVLEALGGFREEFTGPRTAGEDTELAWRARKAGFVSGFAADALVYHEVWPQTFAQALAGAGRRAMVVQVIKFHPETRRLAYHPYFYRPSHLRLVAAGAATLAAGMVRPWAPLVGTAALVGAYLVKTRGAEEPPARRIAGLAEGVAVDAAEVASFAAASVRYRTLLL